MKNLHKTKKTTLMLERKHKELRETFSLTLMKLGMILILCIMGVSVSAQTKTQTTSYYKNNVKRYFATGLSIDITNSMNAADIENNIQNAIAGATSGEVITVTGNKTNENGRIELNIPVDVTVVWNAVSEGLSFSINGGGTFEVAENGKIEVTKSNHMVIAVETGNITVSGGKISGTGQNISVVDVNNGNITVSGGEIVADGDGWGYSYAVSVNISGTIKVTGGSVSAINAINNVAIYMGGGLAAYLKGTCNGIFQAFGTSIIVEVESLDIPNSYGGTNDGLTHKAGSAITTVKWDVSGAIPIISFNNGSYKIGWAAPDTEPPVTPAEKPVRIKETGDLFETLNEAITAAKDFSSNTFTLEVIGDVLETSSVIIDSENITIVGVDGKHTFAFANPSPPSGFKFSVNGGGKLTLGDGTDKNTLTILHSVSVTDGNIDVKNGVILESAGSVALLMSGPNANGTISGGRFEATGSSAVALSLEKGAILNEISGGTFVGKIDALHLSDMGTRIELISGGAFYQKGAYAEIGMLHGHAVFVQNEATIGEIAGGYFEADPKANSAMVVIRGAWVDKISGGEFVASRPGTTREPSDDQWNSVIHVENRVSEDYSLTGIGTISGGHFYGGAHFGMLLITNGTGTSRVNEITGGFFEGIVGVQNDVGGHIGTISGGKIYGSQGMLNTSIIDKITGDADIRGSSTYGIYNYYTNSSCYGKIVEISGGKITSIGGTGAHALQNSGVIDSITGGTIITFSTSASANGITNYSSYNSSPRIGKITGGTIASMELGNGIYNAGIINEISGGKIFGGLGTDSWITGDASGNGIYNYGTITKISNATVIGYKNAINCDSLPNRPGALDTIFNGVFWGQTKPAINLVKTMVLEPGLDATIGFGRYWGKDGMIFNNDDLVDFPGDYRMSAETKAVEGIQEVEFKYLKLPLNLVTLDLKLFLQGVTQPGSVMTNNIQVPIMPGIMPNLKLPVINPYGLPDSCSNINNVSAIGEIVDWILVEIWGDLTVNGMFTDYTLLEQRALLLKPDGLVVDTTGQKPQFIPFEGDVRIMVKHRSHLSVISSELLTFSGKDTVIWDFSTGIDKALKPFLATYDPMILQYGVASLWAGDLNMNDIIDHVDMSIFNIVWKSNTFGQYIAADINMDGIVNNTDLSFVTQNTKLGLYSPIYFFKKR